MEVGQTVTVTADAVEDKVYEGVVTKVTHKGTTSGGVTTYPGRSTNHGYRRTAARHECKH